jgi:alpha-glucoside transport system permease protein
VSTILSTSGPKFAQVLIAVFGFLAIMSVIFWIAGRANGRKVKPIANVVFLGPAVVLLMLGLIVPAFQTIIFSFKGEDSIKWVGLSNYDWIFTDPDMRKVLFNTFLWMLFVPIFTTLLGLTLAIFMDRMKRESVPKSLIFMPMAISFVGASIIWRFVYNYSNGFKPQVGLLSAVVKTVGGHPQNWLLEKPLNTFLLMVIFIWVQTGFAMVILSAAIKAVPADIVEASALDGASGFRLFRFITFPSVRSTFIVVLATQVVGALKIFDVVRTMTGGNFGTNVIANEMYSQIFVQFNQGKGAALAIVLFLLVVPVLIFNMRNLRLERSER